MDISEQLIKAAKNGNAKEVRKLLSRGAVFTKDEFGNTALHEASWTGNQDIVKMLLKANCSVDSVNVSGFSPLHMACQNGHAKVAKTLLKGKATATLRNQHDEAPLHVAAKYDHAQMIPVFAAAKADLNIKAKDENTPLHIAAKLGNLATVKALIQAGANPNISNKKAKLPIDYAEIGDYHSTVKILIPFTERIRPRKQTMDSSYNRCNTPPDLSSRARSRSFFTKTRPKDMWATPPLNGKQGADSPHSLHDVELRKKSKSFTPVTTKRYSKEFEDLPLKSTPSNASILSDQHSPSLEDLIEELEVEQSASGYKYVSPSSDESEDNTSVTYKSIHRFSPLTNRPICRTPTPPSKPVSPTGVTPLGCSLPNIAKSRFSGTPSPLASPLQPTKNPLYDYLAPATTTDTTRNSVTSDAPPSSEETVVFNISDDDDSYVSLTPSRDTTPGVRTRPSSESRDNMIYSHPVLSDDVINHCYEYLPPLKDDAGEGFESYVYMAPRKSPPRKSTSSLKEASPSPLVNSKRAAVLFGEYKHDPLSATQKHNSTTEIDQYMEAELGSMKQALHAHLSQVDKKYHPQLSLQGPHPSIRGNVAATPLYQNVFTQRASWHGDSQEDTRQDDASGNVDELPDTAKKLIEQKLEEYKKEMMDMFMEKTKLMEKNIEQQQPIRQVHRKESMV